MLYTYTVNEPCCCSKYVAEITGANVNLQYTLHQLHKLEHFLWNSIHFAKINTGEIFGLKNKTKQKNKGNITLIEHEFEDVWGKKLRNKHIQNHLKQIKN